MSEQDFEVIQNPDRNLGWYLDIDIIDGWGKPLFGDSKNNARQRAALASFTSYGSIPGAESRGIKWADMLTGDVTMVQIDKSVKDVIKEVAGGDSVLPTGQLQPVYFQTTNRKGVYMQLTEG